MTRRTRKQTVTVEEPQPAQPLWREAPKPVPAPLRETVRPARPGAARPPGRAADAVASLRAVPWRQFASLLLLVAAVGGFVWLWTSDFFRVNRGQTQVRGTQRVEAEAIYAAAGIDGLPVFLLRPAAVAARVKKVTGIEDSRVHLRLPAQVIVEVRECTPFVVWRAVTQTIWLDERGEIVPVAGPPPALTLVDEEGAGMQADGKLAQGVLASLRELHTARPDLSEIHYGALEGLFFRDPEGWTVYLGRSGSLQRKLDLLEAARPELRARRPTPATIDLRFGDAALVR